MAEYIAKWGRRVGFDLNVEPSEGQKTHAIIQVRHVAVGTGGAAAAEAAGAAADAASEEGIRLSCCYAWP